MMELFLPKRADNSYRGRRLAIVLFVIVLLMKTGISLGSMFNGRTAATSADGIPIDSYTPAGAQTVLSLFAVLGLANLVICLIGAVVLFRYRSLIAFMFALFLAQQLGRNIILRVLPIARIGTPPGSTINLTIFALMIVGLLLALWPRAVEREPHG